jgi:hypothetical protein
METRQPSKSDCSAGRGPLLERNRYYTGKFMTARDFQGEQDYLRSRHHLHNRLLHGWGIVCGLEVVLNPRQECQNTTVVVKAGVALDCHGREVVLTEDTVFEVPRPTPPVAAPDSKPLPREELLLSLYFTEESIELTPAIFSEGVGETESDQANRIREGATLRLVSLDKVNEGCWNKGGLTTRCRDDCDDQIPGPAGGCIEPECPCGGGVPLALLSFHLDRGDDAIAIDSDGRRRLPIHADYLTHIVHTNWHHGGTMTLSHLRDRLHGRLEIRFDRKIRAATQNLGVGVSEYTFVAQFGGIQEDIRYLPYRPDQPPVLEQDCVAVFRIDPVLLDSKRRDDLKDKVIYVSLKCDFILDCRGMPVDGAHLGGTLPTRGGRMGGTFESWFSISEEDGGREPYEHKDQSPRRSKSKKGDEE